MIDKRLADPTPGEFFASLGSYDEDPNRWSVMMNAGDKQYFIATIENGAPGDTLETEKANAYLLTASKGMQGALESVCGLILMWRTQNISVLPAATCERVERALAKSRGET